MMRRSAMFLFVLGWSICALAQIDKASIEAFAIDQGKTPLVENRSSEAVSTSTTMPAIARVPSRVTAIAAGAPVATYGAIVGEVTIENPESAGVEDRSAATSHARSSIAAIASVSRPAIRARNPGQAVRAGGAVA